MLVKTSNKSIHLYFPTNEPTTLVRLFSLLPSFSNGTQGNNCNSRWQPIKGSNPPRMLSRSQRKFEKPIQAYYWLIGESDSRRRYPSADGAPKGRDFWYWISHLMKYDIPIGGWMPLLLERLFPIGSWKSKGTAYLHLELKSNKRRSAGTQKQCLGYIN